MTSIFSLTPAPRSAGRGATHDDAQGGTVPAAARPAPLDSEPDHLGAMHREGVGRVPAPELCGRVVVLPLTSRRGVSYVGAISGPIASWSELRMLSRCATAAGAAWGCPVCGSLTCPGCDGGRS